MLNCGDHLAMDPCSDDDTVVTSNVRPSNSITQWVNSFTAGEVTCNLKATKADDAEAPEYLWDRQLIDLDDPFADLKLKALSSLRSLCLRWWKWHLLREFLTWFQQTHQSLTTSSALRDWNAGRECISRAWNSTWWEWSDGSRPFFWRWTPKYRTTIRDGHRLWVCGPFPRWKVPQRSELNPDLRLKI
jgi:hypothetical protein